MLHLYLLPETRGGPKDGGRYYIKTQSLISTTLNVLVVCFCKNIIMNCTLNTQALYYINTIIGIVDIRLVNGTNEFSGRVEVFYERVWGTVCDDRLDCTDNNILYILILVIK